MRAYFLLFFILEALPICATGQQFRGRVYDAASAAPVAAVLITNTHSGAMWVSDSAGNMAFTAFPGDVVTLQHPAYKPYKIVITTDVQAVDAGLTRNVVELNEVQVLSPMLKFRRDSAFNHQFFRKELAYAHSKSQMNYSGGVGMDGLFSELALAVSGKKKQYRRFADEMAFLEEMRYSSIRYTPSLVMAQTGLKDSAADAFIIRHPIPNDFVRAASELELKMWVREQYRAEAKTDSLKQH